MSIRSRIFLGILAVVAIGFYFLADWMADDLSPQYRRSTEEPLVDTARILASIAAMSATEGRIDVELFRKAFQDVYSRRFSAKIYDFQKTRVDFRVYITDALGTVIFDSEGRDEGKDYSRWRDVRFTLEGHYGARTSRDVPADPKASLMYVASPIVVQGEIIGALSVGKPTQTVNQFVESAKNKITIGATATSIAVIIVGLIISGMVTQPIKRLTDYAKAVRDGERAALPPLGKSEIRGLGLAFEQMRDALEGKKYVENYVQNLTHEIKSPLSAIQGAVELLSEDVPLQKQARFLENIRSETDRIKAVVEKLLLLSSLEARNEIREVEEIDISEILHEVKNSLITLLETKDLTFEIVESSAGTFKGERFLIQDALSNLVTNAIEFSPRGGFIQAEIFEKGEFLACVISDEGPGIPDYALKRVFERFYSLKRPDTGRKSSGLGLSLVQEVAMLHNGRVEVDNRPHGGTEARIFFRMNSI